MASPLPTRRLTITQIIAHFEAAHGVRISRATFWRYFLPPERNGMEHWCGELEHRPPNVAVTFTPSDVDRMARSYSAYRSGKPAWYAAGTAGSTTPPPSSPRDRLRRPQGGS